MNPLTLRPLETVSALELAASQNDAFADYEPSKQLAEVLAAEAAARAAEPALIQSVFGLAAYRGEVLVAWSQGYREGESQFYMQNSGEASAERRKGVYS